MTISNSAAFLTLTYEVEPLTPNGHGTLKKSDVQKFLKRLRKRNNSSRTIRYYCCGEYGSRFKRPHYHLIIFNVNRNILDNSELLAKDIWKHGQVHVLPCNTATICYTVGYVMKGAWIPDDEVDINTGLILQDDRVPEFSTMSKNLGLCYLTENRWDWHVSNMIGTVDMPNGSMISMPRYFKQKVFSKDEREELAAEARMIRDIPVDWWTEENTKIYLEAKTDSIRRAQKQELLKRMKL